MMLPARVASMALLLGSASSYQLPSASRRSTIRMQAVSSWYDSGTRLMEPNAATAASAAAEHVLSWYDSGIRLPSPEPAPAAVAAPAVVAAPAPPPPAPPAAAAAVPPPPAPAPAAINNAPSGGWQTVVANARGRAEALKADQDATVAAMAVGTLGVYALPLFSNGPFDLVFSTAVGGGLSGYVAGFRDDAAGAAARKVGGTVSSAVGQAGKALDDSGVLDTVKEKLPGGGGEGLSMKDIKKYGVAGTIAYILTELAFWVVAFPVASTSFYNLNGHWPDLGDGADRTAVLAFIFAGANVARLAVPLRFGAAFAIAPWVDENICAKLGIGSGDGDADSQ